MGSEKIMLKKCGVPNFFGFFCGVPNSYFDILQNSIFLLQNAIPAGNLENLVLIRKKSR